jgi:hypothetical protein
VGSLFDTFGQKSFALLFALLLAVSALPLPTGGATHGFEILAVLVALQLIAGRHTLWLPRRWRERELAGPRQRRLVDGLTKFIRRLERFSRPRLRRLFEPRAADIAFGVLVIAGCAGAFFAPPFTGLDTLPSLGVVLLSLAVVFEDALLALIGVIFGVIGVVLELALGAAAIHALRGLL